MHKSKEYEMLCWQMDDVKEEWSTRVRDADIGYRWVQ